MKRVWPAALLLLAGLWVVIPGCSSDDPGEIPIEPDLVVVDVDDGLWQITSTVSEHHPGFEGCSPDSTTVDTTGLCSLVFLSGEDSRLGLTCTVDTTRGLLSFTCDQERNLSPCIVTFHTEGSGTYDRVGYTMTWERVSAVRGDPICEDALPSFADPCTLTIVETGVFLEASTDSIRGCADGDTTAAKAFLDRVFGGPTGY